MKRKFHRSEVDAKMLQYDLLILTLKIVQKDYHDYIL